MTNSYIESKYHHMVEDLDSIYHAYEIWVSEQNKKGVEIFKKKRRQNIYVRQYNVELLSKEEFSNKLNEDIAFRNQWVKQ